MTDEKEKRLPSQSTNSLKCVCCGSGGGKKRDKDLKNFQKPE